MSLSPVFQTSACTSCPFHNCISFPWLIYWSDAIKYQLTTAVIIFELQNISYPHLPVVVKIQLYDVLEWELKLFHSTFFLLQLFIFYHINKLWQKNTILRKRHLHDRAELVLLHAKPGDDHLGQQEREMMIAMNFSEDLSVVMISRRPSRNAGDIAGNADRREFPHKVGRKLSLRNLNSPDLHGCDMGGNSGVSYPWSI